MISPPTTTTSIKDGQRIVAFTTQLYHQLKAIARGRELCDPLQNQMTNEKGRVRGRSGEVNGWEVEKKMVMLTELRSLFEQPCFAYADCGASSVSGPFTTNGVLFMDVYFNKTHPLIKGQHTLLDVWEYLMDMCEYVPVRNRCRALYLHVATCICRRIEFIPGFSIGKDRVIVDDKVNERYYELFERCITLCATQLEHSQLLMEEYTLFTSHMMTMVNFRCPNESLRLMEAVEECERVLRNDPERCRQRRKSMDRRRRSRCEPVVPYPPPSPSSTTALSSNKHPQHQWHVVLEHSKCVDGVETQQKAILTEFSRYKTSRFMMNTSNYSLHRRSTVELTVLKALEADIVPGEAITQTESSFISNLPILFAFPPSSTFKSTTFQSEVSRAVTLFSNLLQAPERDNISIVPYVGAFLNDIVYWCRATTMNHRQRILWHCVPGYIPLVRTFIAVFERMCQRRPRKSNTTTVNTGNVSEESSIDHWSSYWTNREVNGVLDTMRELLQNTRLVNPIVQIVLEGTNIFDSASVNYSLSVLQRVLSIAAASNPSSECLGDDFDAEYFVHAMQHAFQSAHVQILLKSLTCLYSCIDLLPSRGRRLIISQLILGENFSRLFLHWNEEICKIYCYILVFKLFTSTRLDLPCATDRILLAHSPFFEASSTNEPSSPSSPSFGYWSHLSDFARSILPHTSVSTEGREAQRKTAMSHGLKNLVQWDTSAKLHRERLAPRISIFRMSLDDDVMSVDLLVASKVDSMLKMLVDHMRQRQKPSSTTTGPSSVFPLIAVEQEAYAERAMAVYVGILWEYYVAACERPDVRPTTPKLEFTITSHCMAD